MSRLPVIAAIGGINPAGRTSCHHGFNRMIFEALDASAQDTTLRALSALTGQHDAHTLLNGTLIRKLENTLFDPEAVPMNCGATTDQPVELAMRNMDLPDPLPPGWRILSTNGSRSRVQLPAHSSLFAPITRKSLVMSAGQLPSGFDPAALYTSRNHPRALQLSVYGASDALGALGMDWEQLRNRIAPHQIAVYASNAMSQMDDNGLGGMMKNPQMGKRITSKQVPLGLGEMAADFINAYVLGTCGSTGGGLGACATFLYNLSTAVHDIRAGRRRLAFVGTSEAPLVPEIIEGYRAMGALGEDAELLHLDGGVSTPDYRRACRPFAENCGFTIAESAQFMVLMDDELALETGAHILGAVPDVFINADGIKKSISAPGIGNYLTLGRAMKLTEQLLGRPALQHHSFFQAHGTGTPQNRVTESHVANELAKAFGIEALPVSAIKCFIGHSLGSASGDQMAATLGSFASGMLPGVTTVTAFADDLHDSNLSLSTTHRPIDAPAAAFINSKGFGGNNATALALSPQSCLALLSARHGKTAITDWQAKAEHTRAAIADYDNRNMQGDMRPIYRFGEAVLEGDDLGISHEGIRIPGWDKPVVFDEDESLAGWSLHPDKA